MGTTTPSGFAVRRSPWQSGHAEALARLNARASPGPQFPSAPSPPTRANGRSPPPPRYGHGEASRAAPRRHSLELPSTGLSLEDRGPPDGIENLASNLADHNLVELLHRRSQSAAGRRSLLQFARTAAVTVAPAVAGVLDHCGS